MQLVILDPILDQKKKIFLIEDVIGTNSKILIRRSID